MKELAELIRRDPGVFLHSRASKRDRECWVVAMILVGVHKLTGDYWFMRMEERDPPDAVAVMFQADAEGKRLVGHEVPIEVVFVPKYVRDQTWDTARSAEENLFDVLDRTKFQGKRYEPRTTLFVYLNLEQGQVRLDALSARISSRRPTLGGVWLLVGISPDGEKYLVHQAYPEIRQVELSLSEVVKWPAAE